MWWAWTNSGSDDTIRSATLLRALGRTREAARWYNSIAERAAYELPFLAPAQLRLAGIARANGDLKAAQADADPPASCGERPIPPLE